ncbi:MAG: MalY/PatB family protein [Candidatus Hodarchaeales archaeon]|jgi:cystathionine beta-lyase
MVQNDTYNFDEIIDRSNTGAAKWDPRVLTKLYGNPDLLPLWVADMDFKVPQPVTDALVKRAEHGMFGYTLAEDSHSKAVINWFKCRHDWSIDDPEWLVHSPGIVAACNNIIQRFTHPGDKIIIQPPVYYPFAKGIQINGRQVVNNQLKLVDDHYEIDHEDLQDKVKDPETKILILCSPHNPVGRVWTRKELTELGETCLQNDILVVSDEIHCDLVYPRHEHVVFASISDEFAQNTITCTSGSKTFNLAGLHQSNIIIANEKLRQEFKAQMSKNALGMPNVFGALALQVAYDQGGEWLDALIAYLDKNLEFLRNYLEENLPGIKIIEPEGTYLVWVDFRKLGLDEEGMKKLMNEKARVALDHGEMFGSGGEGFERINIACPRELLREALERIKKVVEPLL